MPRATLRSASLAFLLVVSAGCYEYVVTTPNPEAGTEYRTRTGHSYFWGLI